MAIEHWRVVQVETPNHPPHALPEGLPAELLTHDAQWVQHKDPDTGELVSSFVGPTFEGTEITLELQADGDHGSLGIIARYERFVADPPTILKGRRPPDPRLAGAYQCPSVPGKVEVLVVGTVAHESGTFRLAPDKPAPGRITIILSPIEADDENPTD